MLIFPMREEQSSDSLNKIKQYYNIHEDFELVGLPHNLPFGKIRFFNKTTFHISQYLWARKTVKNITKDSLKTDIFITRSDWVFYFLLKKIKRLSLNAINSQNFEE